MDGQGDREVEELMAKAEVEINKDIHRTFSDKVTAGLVLGGAGGRGGESCRDCGAGVGAGGRRAEGLSASLCMCLYPQPRPQESQHVESLHSRMNTV